MKIKINDVNYKVVFVDQIVDAEGESLGRFIGDTQTIEISKSQNPSRMKATIKHELTHAFIYAHCLGTEYDEEFICNFVEMYGEQILKATEKICKARKL